VCRSAEDGCAGKDFAELGLKPQKSEILFCRDFSPGDRRNDVELNLMLDCQRSMTTAAFFTARPREPIFKQVQ
jgi:hypothetical protein